MIYLILTASLTSGISSTVSENRLERYQYAIQESLSCLPDGVQPIIVENTSSGHGGGAGSLDHFTCHEKRVPVWYTDNGHHRMKNKGVNEWLDIKAVIDQWDMKDNDIIVKLTGRYRLLSSQFIEQIRATETEKDAWFRFLNVCTEKEDPEDCVLGCYGARVSCLRYLSWSWMNLFDSPERAMAKHIRSSVSTKRLAEMVHLDVECVFSEDGRVLCV